MKKIKIFDTTLRDGEQSPGASLNAAEKMRIALALENMGVDIIEAGFPVSSPDDFSAVNEIARRVKKSVVCGLARATKEDIEAAYEAIKPARKKRIHTFLATSDVHLKYKLKITRGQALKQIREMVSFARKKVDDVEFSPEDGYRTEPKFLFKALETAINAGATTVNIPDTVGYAVPEKFGALIADIRKNVPNIKEAIISVHCHNDLGMATANSLSAVANGAEQVECTINGLGERAGNAALEEIVMALKTRGDYFKCITGIKTREIINISKLVSKLTGIPVQPNKAIVGDNAFAHEAGIHQHGVLSNRETYEIMKAEDIGLTSNELVLGKHSGKHGFADRLKKIGVSLDKKQLEEVFKEFKGLADKKKKVYDEDLMALVSDRLQTEKREYTLELLQVVCGNSVKPLATVELKNSKGEVRGASVVAAGPIDAVYHAIDKIINEENELLEFSVKAITAGKDAQAEVLTKIRKDGRIYCGYGVSNDIVLAAAKSYLNAVNIGLLKIKNKK